MNKNLSIYQKCQKSQCHKYLLMNEIYCLLAECSVNTFNVVQLSLVLIYANQNYFLHIKEGLYYEIELQNFLIIKCTCNFHGQT